MASKFGINVPATLAFDYPTPGALSKYVAANLPSRQTQPTQHHESAEAIWEASFVSGDIEEKLHAIVCGVLGASISPDQPLMEVCLVIPLCFLVLANSLLITT